MNDSYLYAIILLMPLTAFMVIFQANPYHALVIRGILGAVSALVYAVLGAADVALTEALVGTMLAITLYAIAVRSSLVLRLGILREDEPEAENLDLKRLIADLHSITSKKHLRLELVPYEDRHALQQALWKKEIHATCSRLCQPEEARYETTIRVEYLYEILKTELSSPITSLSYLNLPTLEEKH
ncbi:MAG: DUF4040 domain-containing protein [Chloroflexaceae bacterium]|nr:DUF4040 domain-containing protein [Chloroflexaceae bacterium]